MNKETIPVAANANEEPKPVGYVGFSSSRKIKLPTIPPQFPFGLELAEVLYQGFWRREPAYQHNEVPGGHIPLLGARKIVDSPSIHAWYDRIYSYAGNANHDIAKRYIGRDVGGLDKKDRVCDDEE